MTLAAASTATHAAALATPALATSALATSALAPAGDTFAVRRPAAWRVGGGARVMRAQSATVATGSASAFLLLAVILSFAAEDAPVRQAAWPLRGTLAPAAVSAPESADATRVPAGAPHRDAAKPGEDGAGLHRPTKTV